MTLQRNFSGERAFFGNITGLNASLCANSSSVCPYESPSSSDSFGATYSVLLSCLYALICVTGVPGNSLVIGTVLRSRKMWTPCNYLIMTVAIADLGVAALHAPLRIAERFVGWPFGEFACQMLAPLQDVFICVSVLAHTAIAMERHRAIVTPFKKRISIRQVQFIIAGLWLGSYVTSGLPIAPLLRVTISQGRPRCGLSPEFVSFGRVFTVFLVIAYILLPLAIQTCSYFLIIKKLRRKTLVSSTEHARRRNHLIKMLVTCVVVFDICYLPRGVLVLVNGYGEKTAALRYVNLLALVMYYVKHVINPFILFAMSTEYRANLQASCWCRGVSEEEESAHAHHHSRSPKTMENGQFIRESSF